MDMTTYFLLSLAVYTPIIAIGIGAFLILSDTYVRIPYGLKIIKKRRIK